MNHLNRKGNFIIINKRKFYFEVNIILYFLRVLHNILGLRARISKPLNIFINTKIFC